MSTTSSSASNSFPQMAKVTAAYLHSQMQRNIHRTAKEPKTIPTQAAHHHTYLLTQGHHIMSWPPIQNDAKNNSHTSTHHQRRISHHLPPGVGFPLSLNSFELDDSISQLARLPPSLPSLLCTKCSAGNCEGRR